MSMSTVTSFAALSSADLATATGGASDPQITINPKLECPAGTSPSFTNVNGKVDVKTPAGVGVTGQGQYTNFHCDPIPQSQTFLRPGGDR